MFDYSDLMYPIRYDNNVDPNRNSSRDKGDYINEIVKMFKQAGINISNYDGSGALNLAFDKIVKNYQKKHNLPVDGAVTFNLLKNVEDTINKSNPEKIEDDTPASTQDITEEDAEDDDLYDPHYEPFFLNTSGKVYKRNRKDIIISIGDGTVIKRIKDVYMRSVSTEFDTSGKPISEVYQFIARDVKESDAPEDDNIYIGEDDILQASSDIKYNFDDLFKDK